MSCKHFILITIVVLCFCISLQSCKKTKDHIHSFEVSNSQIKGQAFIGGSSRSIDYSPKGKFIQVILPDSGIWTHVLLKKSTKLIEPKLFFPADDYPVTHIYDHLNAGAYQVEYISAFEDTIREKLSFDKSIQLEFPKKLDDYYNEVKIQDFDINNLKPSDTLQFYYHYQGCFGGSITLIEFVSLKNDSTHLERNIIIYDSLEKEAKRKDTIERKMLTNFIDKAKILVKPDFPLCTSSSNYFFRIKGTNTITIVEDNSCQLMDEKHAILRLD